ncbi:hypothetical protein [Nocardia sp. NPDC019255]|uniref:hypothetical protein n=1 Tax=Nocardia sp. NPDC019255 TaxID=3154591 RepID=UPI0033D0B3C7
MLHLEHSGPEHTRTTTIETADSTQPPTATERMILIEETASTDQLLDSDDSADITDKLPRGPDPTAGDTPDAQRPIDTDTTAPASVDRAQDTGPLDAARQRERAVDAVCARHGVDNPEDRAALEQAYDVVRDWHAPFVVRHTLKVIADCKADIAANPGTVVVFLGRDGHAPALAAYHLDREFFDEHCTEVTVSRRLADTTVQDLERNAGKTFPQLESFRTARDEVDPADIPGAKAQMTRYLESRGVPVGTPGAQIILIDSSFKGTVQELLSATYPHAEFRGRYLMYAESADDPHPGSKTGYALHHPADATRDPDDLAQFFLEKDAVLAIEQILRGPWSKAVRFGADDVPIQTLEAPATDQINPLDIAPEYLEENVRLAVMDINQHAVADYAESIAAVRRDGGDWRGELIDKSEAFMREVRSWVTGDRDTDPAFAQLLGSFVRREDKHIVAELRTALKQRGLDTADTTVWQNYRQLGSIDEKRAYLEQIRSHSTPSTGADHG